MSESRPKVLIFGNMHGPMGKSSWAKLTTEVAESVGWQPLPFNDLDLAVDELTLNIDALATRTLNSFMGVGPDTATLIECSNVLGIPRAVVATGGNSLLDLIRANSSDIIIPDSYPELTASNIGNWLMGLSQRLNGPPDS